MAPPAKQNSRTERRRTATQIHHHQAPVGTMGRRFVEVRMAYRLLLLTLLLGRGADAYASSSPCEERARAALRDCLQTGGGSADEFQAVDDAVKAPCAEGPIAAPTDTAIATPSLAAVQLVASSAGTATRPAEGLPLVVTSGWVAPAGSLEATGELGRPDSGGWVPQLDAFVGGAQQPDSNIALGGGLELSAWREQRRKARQSFLAPGGAGAVAR